MSSLLRTDTCSPEDGQRAAIHGGVRQSFDILLEYPPTCMWAPSWYPIKQEAEYKVDGGTPQVEESGTVSCCLLHRMLGSPRNLTRPL